MTTRWTSRDRGRRRVAAALRARCEGWRAELERVYTGAPETPQGRALQPFDPAFDLPREPFDDLVDGVEMDLDRRRYETFDDLREYCWRVASAVGLVCIEIFGYAIRARASTP